MRVRHKFRGEWGTVVAIVSNTSIRVLWDNRSQEWLRATTIVPIERLVFRVPARTA